MQRRLDQIATMLERDRARGERPPELADVMDHLLAPLYMRALFGTPASEAFAEKLVERLLKDEACRKRECGCPFRDMRLESALWYSSYRPRGLFPS
jgi:hypothetical protein